jgi:HK97 gp10 family phage protein
MAAIWEGMDQLQKDFDKLQTLTKLEILKKAIRKGGNLVKDEASTRAPRDTGALAENMTTRMKDSDLNSLRVDVGPGKNEFYGFFQEYGTALGN